MYLMATTISRVCFGYLESRNIFQGKEKKQSEHCRNSIAQTSWQIKILSLFTFGSLHDVRSFCWLNFSWTWYFHHSQICEKNTANFWPDLLPINSAPVKLRKWSWSMPFWEGKMLLFLMWIKLSRDSDSLGILCNSNGAVFVVNFFVRFVKGNHADLWSSVMNRNCTYHQHLLVEFRTMVNGFFHVPKSNRVKNKTRQIQQNSFSSLVASPFFYNGFRRIYPLEN